MTDLYPVFTAVFIACAALMILSCLLMIPKRTRKFGQIATGATMIALMAAGVLCIISGTLVENKKMAAMKDAFYEAVRNDDSPEGVYGGGDGFVTYDTVDQKFKHQYIPSGKAAQTPDEVGIIILLTRQDIEVGKYTSGANAYRRKYDIQLLDVELWEIFAQESFYGGSPPSASGGGAKYGSVPSAREIRQWIEEQAQLR